MSQKTMHKYLDTGTHEQRRRPVLSPSSQESVGLHCTSFFVTLSLLLLGPWCFLRYLIQLGIFNLREDKLSPFGIVGLDEQAVGLMGLYGYTVIIPLVMLQLLRPDYLKIHHINQWFGDADSDEYKYAYTIFETVYGEYSKAGPVGSNGTSPKKVSKPITAGRSFLLDLKNTRNMSTPTSSAPPKTPPPEKHSEFDHYISGEGGEGDIDKPLDWWRAHCKDIEGVPGFPVISRIARDFLAVPGASVSVERLFSRSRHLCTDLRSSMKAETTTKAMCSKSWLRDGLFEFDSFKLISGQIKHISKTN